MRKPVLPIMFKVQKVSQSSKTYLKVTEFEQVSPISIS